MKLRKITREKLNEVLRLHGMWLRDEAGGVQANLRYTDLDSFNLSGVNLSRANLKGASLSCADLCGANLTLTDLSYTNLAWANLRGANLEWTHLMGASIRFAHLGTHKISIYSFKEYDCYRLNDSFRAGCEWHTIDKWLGFSNRDIIAMDGKKALEFYKNILKPILRMEKKR